VQYWLLLGASLWVQSAQSKIPRALTLLLFVWICFSFFVQGVWLEGRSSAMKLEWSRIGAALLIAAFIYFVWPNLPQYLFQIMVLYSVVSTLAMGLRRVRIVSTSST
jgi:hypothetical protein